MSSERLELLLDLLLAAEVRNLAGALRSRDAKRLGDDSINKRPLEQYLPAALDRLLSVVGFLRDSAVLHHTSGGAEPSGGGEGAGLCASQDDARPALRSALPAFD
jgi:hypothetical protein